MAREAQQRGRKNARKEGGRKTAAKKWWHSLPWSEQDPISLEPLRRCKHEPFTLVEEAHHYRFDPQVLAAYLISSSVFVNPLTRRPLDLSDCVRLDSHLAVAGALRQSVARAWELSREPPTGERERLQSEARDVMRSLFAGRNVRDAISSPSSYTANSPVVVDLDEATVVTDANDDSSEAYPALEATSERFELGSEWAARHARTATRTRAEIKPVVQEAPDAAARRKEEMQRTVRARQLAEAFGVQPDDSDVRWPAELLRWAVENDVYVRRLEARLATVVETGRPVDLAPNRDPDLRKHCAKVVEFYCLSADEFEADVRTERRYLRVRRSMKRFRTPRLPSPRLADAAKHTLPARRDRPPAQHRPVQRRRRPPETPNGDAKLAAVETPTASNVWDILHEDEDSSPRQKIHTQPASTYRVDRDDDCPICLVSLGTESDLVTLTCGHTFHAECFSGWSKSTHERSSHSDEIVSHDHLLRTASCPQCRRNHVLTVVQLPQDRW